jgi:tetratricopeptide (TPR) repeat protein
VTAPKTAGMGIMALWHNSGGRVATSVPLCHDTIGLDSSGGSITLPGSGLGGRIDAVGVCLMSTQLSNDNVIFVAMPGRMHGPNVSWKDVSQIKKYLYERVAREVSERLGIPYRIQIEVDEDRPGNIHRSMFSAALRAPIYIADLTGLNANVYLELGVRWAVRDNVTVLTCQSVKDDLAFNVSPSKAVEYGNDPDKLALACQKIVDMIARGVGQPNYVDSLVRQDAELVTLDRKVVEKLYAENEKLHRERGDGLVAAARNAPHDKRVALLLEAIKVSPANQEAHFLLGVSAISNSEYDAAIRHLTEATRLDPSFVSAWRQLGVAQSRGGALEDAAASMRRAVFMDPRDAEAYSILGGIYRRMARRYYQDTGSYDTSTLRQARDAYNDAGRIDHRNTYPLMNVARLDLQLAGDDEAGRQEALNRFKELENLARYSAHAEGNEDKWKWFDLADALALTGKIDDALAAAREGLLRFEATYRATNGAAAAEPLEDILKSTPLPTEVRSAVRAVVAAYRAAVVD